MNYAEVLRADPVFSIVAESAAALGTDAYVVGGFVRDHLLGRQSAQPDVDFVCVGSGIALAEAVAQRLGQAQVTVYKTFGTALVRHQHTDLEFAGARRESYRRDSRKPLVEDGTLAEDQLRRDFTINALALSLNAGDYGALLDPFDGVRDLRRRMIRTPRDPAITFSDDPLRMMRAVRFAAQLNFDIDPDTFAAIRDQQARIEIVSAERISAELNKIILSPTPSYGFKLLYHAGLLERIFPELVELQGVETIDGKGHKDNFYHTLQVLDNVAVAGGDLWLRWAALLHDIAKPATKRFDKKVGWTFHGHEDLGARMVPKIFQRLRLPLHEKMRSVRQLVRLHLRPIALAKKTVTDSAIRRLIVEAGHDLEDLLTLCRADITSKNPDRVRRHLANFERVAQRVSEVEEIDELRNFQPVLTGEDIMQAFALKPGKLVGEIKNEIREAILEGDIRNEYAEAFALMRRIGQRHGLTAQAE